jgi:glycosyltransferase involved in cell wall biosynthesis
LGNFEVSEKTDDFEVIHLSTGHLGGAGLAARRLNEALNKSGVKSTFAALDHKDFIPLSNETTFPRNLSSKLLGRSYAFSQSRLSKKVFFSIFSHNSIDYRFFLKNPTPQTTILHIHNWFNLLNLRAISKLQKNGFKIVITLHDQRFMTGGCHYAFTCNKFESNCSKCPLLPKPLNMLTFFMLQYSKMIIGRFSQKISFVAPSNWILGEARKSRLLKNENIFFIPNTLGSVEQDLHPSRLNNITTTSRKGLKLGIASMLSESYIKGGDITAEISKLLYSSNLGFEFVYLNDFAQNEIGKAQFWNSIDYLLVLSRAENSPNVIHEAKQHGVPVIASKVGGITELLNLDYDVGIDLDDLNTASVVSIISSVPNRKLSQEATREMQSEFHRYVGQSVTSHTELYKKMMLGN